MMDGNGPVGRGGKPEIVRPPRVKRSRYTGWKDRLADVLSGNTLDARTDRMKDAALGGDPVSVLEETRVIMRHELAQPAEALGIPADHPLLAELVAFELAQRAELWNAPKPVGGRPRKPAEEAAAMCARLEDFLVRYKTAHPAVSETKALAGKQFQQAFPNTKPQTARRILSDGRRKKRGQKEAPPGVFAPE